MYQNWFLDSPPVLVLEKEKAGYVMVSGRDFIVKAAGHSAIFYELLLKMHATSWRRSDSVKTWITESPVDFVHGQTGRCQMFHRPINIHQLFAGEEILRRSEYQLANVLFDREDVVLAGLDMAGNLALRKKTGGHDPLKRSGDVSALLEDGSVIQHLQRVMYKLETGMTATLFENDGQWKLLVSKTSSSSRGIHLQDDAELPLLTENMRLCYQNGSLGFVGERSYQESLHGQWLIKIEIEQARSVSLHDVRVFGGGDSEDDADYGRIGKARLDGRPLRRGGAFVVRLPKQTEVKKEAIEQALVQVAAGGEYPVIVFE